MFKKFVKMLWLIKKSAYVIYEWPLRNLKPEGNLLEDRFKSMQARNIFETRTKPKCPKAKRIKKVEKRSYKMGFAFEKTGLDKKGKNKTRR